MLSRKKLKIGALTTMKAAAFITCRMPQNIKFDLLSFSVTVFGKDLLF